MLGAAQGTGSALAGARRCRGCFRPEHAEVIAWRNGRWAFLTGTCCYVFEPWGVPLTKEAEVAKQLDDAGFRTLVVILNDAQLCPRCAHTFPRRPARAWRR